MQFILPIQGRNSREEEEEEGGIICAIILEDSLADSSSSWRLLGSVDNESGARRMFKDVYLWLSSLLTAVFVAFN